jgi:hypothetical protein
MRLKKIIILAFSIATLGACNKKLDELLVNPNSPSPDKANADLYLTQAQLSFADFFNSASNFGGAVSRMYNMGAFTYLNAYSPESFNGIWSSGYTGVLKHVNALIPVAEAQKSYVNLGIAKTLKAYTLITMVDLFGDIPFDEANLGSENTNPAAQSGKVVYDSALALLDQAVVAFNTLPGTYPGTNDLFFGATNATGAARWRTAAKLIKLRALATTRLVDAGAAAKINALLADADVVASRTDPARDFEFKYSTKQANPNSRHPRYNANYAATGNAGDYMSTYFMWTLVQEKGSGNTNNDPRSRYYFYRQVTNFGAVNENTASCAGASAPAHYTAGMPYCLLIAGYWGRDHGDGTGIPPDGNLRTTVGIYPAGGDFDSDQGTRVALNRGGNGAGIHPIWQSAFTDFLQAEAALTIGTTGTPRTLLESGVRKSMAKVIGYPATIGFSVPASFVPSAARIDAYVAKVLAAYDAATTNAARLDVIMKEWYIAAWGNGMEAFNNFRRTGKPANVQFTRLADPGTFTRSMLYPATYVNLNKTAQQKASVATQVFWDNNPPGFIK